MFSYYYFDIGNTRAPHGGAPAVGIGHQTANPDPIVIRYHGDGDLASIGLAEIISAARWACRMTVSLVSNAIFGMTERAGRFARCLPGAPRPRGHQSQAGGAGA